jgi:hypothetical protein
MPSHANTDTPKKVRITVLDDRYIREFDRMMDETRQFNRDLDERRRQRGVL